jgi:hypothetical protein
VSKNKYFGLLWYSKFPSAVGVWRSTRCPLNGYESVHLVYLHGTGLVETVCVFHAMLSEPVKLVSPCGSMPRFI